MWSRYKCHVTNWLILSCDPWTQLGNGHIIGNVCTFVQKVKRYFLIASLESDFLILHCKTPFMQQCWQKKQILMIHMHQRFWKVLSTTAPKYHWCKCKIKSLENCTSGTDYLQQRSVIQVTPNGRSEKKENVSFKIA